MAPILKTNSKTDKSESSRSTSSRIESRRNTTRSSNSREKARSLTNQKEGESSNRTKSSSESLKPEQAGKKGVGIHPLPSSRLNKHKQASIFTSGKKKHKTNFSSAYDSGMIPCRINHGSIRNSLQWTRDPHTLSFDPLLITCVEGFLETEHPFVFLARSTFRELVKLEDAREKTLSILSQVIVPLRKALMAQDNDTFLMALEATRLLSGLVEGEMNVYLPKLTQQIHRKLLTKQLRTDVEETLAILEGNGGKEALAIIRSKIPTYVSIR